MLCDADVVDEAVTDGGDVGSVMIGGGSAKLWWPRPGGRPRAAPWQRWRTRRRWRWAWARERRSPLPGQYSGAPRRPGHASNGDSSFVSSHCCSRVSSPLFMLRSLTCGARGAFGPYVGAMARSLLRKVRVRMGWEYEAASRRWVRADGSFGGSSSTRIRFWMVPG